MSTEELKAKLSEAMSIPCIKIEIRLGVSGPVLLASHTDTMMDSELPNDIKDLLNAAADAALRAALAVLESSPAYEESQIVIHERGVMDDAFFDSSKTITLDAE